MLSITPGTIRRTYRTGVTLPWETTGVVREPGTADELKFYRTLRCFLHFLIKHRQPFAKTLILIVAIGRSSKPLHKIDEERNAFGARLLAAQEEERRRVASVSFNASAGVRL
jgi:hypothetical protein